MADEPASRTEPRKTPDAEYHEIAPGRQGGRFRLDLLEKLALLIALTLTTTGYTIWLNHFNQQQRKSDILNSYIGNMRSLLSANPKSDRDNLRRMASAQTLNTIRRLDAPNNKILFQFLHGRNLIGVPDSVVTLTGADLSKAELEGAPLFGIDLTNADLSRAKLDGADLRHTTLFRANLAGAELRKAKLTGAFLNTAILSKARLAGAGLSNAILTNADLKGADLRHARLSAARLNRAELQKADLRHAHMGGVSLGGADLSQAKLRGVNLSGAKLDGRTQYTPSDFDQVESCEETRSNLPEYGYRCIGNSDIRLTYWFTEKKAEQPRIRSLIGEFERQNPGITINGIPSDFAKEREQFSTAARKAKTPDALRADMGWVTLFAKEGHLLNIDEYFSAREDRSDYDLSGFSTSPLAYNEYNGHLYGLPQVVDCLALLYNKGLLRRPPHLGHELIISTTKIR